VNNRIISISLAVALVLSVGLIGCGGEQVPEITEYNLIISSTEGGSVTTPGEGTFSYGEGAVINLVAQPDEGYQFMKWTGSISAIADVYAAETTITVNYHCSITANFARGIWDWHDLDAVRGNLAGSYILMNDLDSATAGYEDLAGPTANGGKGWQPIGFLNPWDGIGGFRGTFDGQGHEIHDLFINRPDETYVGLFGVIDEGGVVHNIGVVNADVTGNLGVGGLLGYNDGTVTNSYSAGNVTGEGAVGGLVGVNAEGTVSDSYSAGNVTGDMGVGGLVGGSTGNVSNSYYDYDDVLINGQNIIGVGALFDKDFEEWLANDKFLDVYERLSQEDGYYLVNDVSDFKELLAFGQNASLKFRLKNDLDLGNEPNFYIPYLAGEFDGDGHQISNLSFNLDFASFVGLFGHLAPSGKVTQVGVENVNIAAGSIVGGLVGHINGAVSGSYSSGSVTGDYNVGGLAGYSNGIVSNSYSTCNVTGAGRVGGLAGMVGEGTVSNSYCAGSVTGHEDVGGLVGAGSGIVSNSFWDTETSGQAASDGGTGKTTAGIKDIITFLDADWNIITVADSDTRNTAYIWNIVDGETCPFLSWQSVS